MVDGERMGLPAAILTGVIVANEQISPVQLNPFSWYFNKTGQTNHAGYGKPGAYGVNPAGILFHHLRFAHKNQTNRSLHIANGKRFVILI